MNRMREFRKRKRLTMKELGAMVGVTESTISLYETGKRDPDTVTLSMIADALGVTVDEILGRTEKPQPKPGLNEYLIQYMTTLPPEQLQFIVDFLQLPEGQARRVMDFLAGVKAGSRA